MASGRKASLECFTTDEIRELRTIREHDASVLFIVYYCLIAASMAFVAYVPDSLPGVAVA